jgi:hypothetical protein
VIRKRKEIVGGSAVESDLCLWCHWFENYFSLRTLLAMSPGLTRCARAPWALPPTKETPSSLALLAFKRTFS